MSTINIKRFKFKRIPKNPSNILIISKNYENTIKQVISSLVKSPKTRTVIFGTTNTQYQNISQNQRIIEQYNDTTLAAEISEILSQQSNDINILGHDNPSTHLILVFHEFNKDFFSYENVRRLLSFNRHYNMNILIHINHSMSIHPNIRVLLDHVLYDIQEEIPNTVCYQQFFEYMYSYAEFISIYHHLKQKSLDHETSKSRFNRKYALYVLDKIIPHDVANLITEQYMEKTYYTHCGLISHKNYWTYAQPIHTDYLIQWYSVSNTQSI